MRRAVTLESAFGLDIDYAMLNKAYRANPEVQTRYSSAPHATMVALYFMYYNYNYDFGRVHQTLRVMPAMETGIADQVWSIEEVVGRCSRRTTCGTC